MPLAAADAKRAGVAQPVSYVFMMAVSGLVAALERAGVDRAADGGGRSKDGVRFTFDSADWSARAIAFEAGRRRELRLFD